MALQNLPLLLVAGKVLQAPTSLDERRLAHPPPCERAVDLVEPIGPCRSRSPQCPSHRLAELVLLAIEARASQLAYPIDPGEVVQTQVVKLRPHFLGLEMLDLLAAKRIEFGVQGLKHLLCGSDIGVPKTSDVIRKDAIHLKIVEALSN